MSICLVKQNDGTWVEKHQRFLFNVYKRFFLFLSRFFTFFNGFYFFSGTFFLHLWIQKAQYRKHWAVRSRWNKWNRRVEIWGWTVEVAIRGTASQKAPGLIGWQSCWVSWRMRWQFLTECIEYVCGNGGMDKKLNILHFFLLQKKEKQFFESVLKLQLHWSYTQVKLYWNYCKKESGKQKQK